MDLILELEAKFNKINNKLDSNSRVDLINNNYSKDLEAIHRVFDSTKEKKYENGLNECRGEMLRQLIQKRNEQLEQINEFIQSSLANSLSQLKSLHKSIKQNYAAFAKGFPTVYESILFRAKLGNSLNLFELVKYVDLMCNEEQVCLAKVEHLLDLEVIHFRLVYVLPSSRILLYCDGNKKMVVLNKLGDLIGFKALRKDFEYDVLANATNIVVLKVIKRIVDIYNFKLELVHSIRSEQEFYDFRLNNYEIAFSGYDDNYQLAITCYNYKTVQSKKKQVLLSKSEIARIMDIGLDHQYGTIGMIGLNDRFIFIEGVSVSTAANLILLLNRLDNNNPFRYFKSGLYYWFIYNNQIGSISDEFLLIYEIDGSVERESIKLALSIKHVYSFCNDKFIYSRIFNENNSIKKFVIY